MLSSSQKNLSLLCPLGLRLKNPSLVLICISFFLHCSIFKVHSLRCSLKRQLIYITTSETDCQEKFFLFLKFLLEPSDPRGVSLERPINIPPVISNVKLYFSFSLIFLDPLKSFRAGPDPGFLAAVGLFISRSFRQRSSVSPFCPRSSGPRPAASPADRSFRRFTFL